MGSQIAEIVGDPPVITPDLIDYLQIKKKLRIRFSEDRKGSLHYEGEICRIRKDVERANIQLDPERCSARLGSG